MTAPVTGSNSIHLETSFDQGFSSLWAVRREDNGYILSNETVFSACEGFGNWETGMILLEVISRQ